MPQDEARNSEGNAEESPVGDCTSHDLRRQCSKFQQKKIAYFIAL
jgi:hypothetical protein